MAMKPITPLRRAVFEDGRSQKEIAAAAGIHPVTLSRVLGGASCDDATRAAIAHALDVPEADLWPAAQREAA